MNRKAKGRHVECKPARLDAEGTAKPKTRIVNHPKSGWCVGPATVLIAPEYEDENGDRISLV